MAVIGVVVIHIGQWPSTRTHEEYALWNAVVLLARFSVPAFVVLTGMMLEYNRRSGRGAAAFLRRRAERTVVPWIVWAALYLAWGALVSGEAPQTPSGIADWLSYGAGHLYFLLLVPQLYLLFLIWPRGLRAQAVAAGVALALQTSLCIWRLTGPVPDGLTKRLVDWHGAQEAPFWLGYFAVGIVVGHLARNGLRVRRHRGSLAVAGAALVAIGAFLLLRVDPFSRDDLRQFESGTGAFLLPWMPVLVAGVVILVLTTAGTVLETRPLMRAAADRISRDALGIYILQSAILFPVGRLVLFSLLESSAWVSVPAFILHVALTLVLSMAGTELLARTRLRFLVGL